MRQKLSLKLALSAGPLLSLLTGQVTHATAQPEVREGGNLPETEKNNVRTAAIVGPVCDPFLANTKTVGVPIQVQDEFGQIMNDLTGLTFELTDGTNTQDVTSLIGDADDQLLSSSLKSVYQQYFQNSSSSQVDAPTVSFASSSQYFLACSPDRDNDLVTFGSSVVLSVKRGSDVISTASLNGRAPVRHEWNFFVDDTDQGPVATLLKPSSFGTANITLDLIYNEFLTNIGVSLDNNFASILTGIFYEYGTKSVDYTCANLFWDQTGFSSRALRLIEELKNVSSSLNRIEMLSFIDGSDQSINCAIPSPVSQNDPYLVSDYLINLITSQLLLVNGPKGEIPADVQAMHHSLASATVLRPENPLPLPTTPPSPTTTVVQSETTAPTTTVQSVPTRLPKTGTSVDGAWLAATLLALGFGFVGIRRSRSSLD